MTKVMLSLSILMLGICTVTSHDIIYKEPPAGRSKYSFSLSPPSLIIYPYYVTKPLFVGYPGIYVHQELTTKATKEVPVVTIVEATDDNSDLYGCGTDYGPWWTPAYCRRYLLHWSATAGNITLAQNLLSSGRDIDLQHNVQRTALHIAAHWGRATMVEFLLRRGADPNLLDMWGYKAVELAELRKCDDEEYSKTWRLSCTGAESNYPATIALLKAEAPVVTTVEVTDDNSDLYGCGTDYGPWWTPDYCRRYLLHWSATSGNITLAQYLLSSGRDIDLQHNVQRTALHIAAHWGRATMVRFLLRRGADPNLLDMWGFKALELAELRKCDDEEYSKTWSLSCTGAESNYPATIAILKAGCEMTSCISPYHCVHKECIKLQKNLHKNQS